VLLKHVKWIHEYKKTQLFTSWLNIPNFEILFNLILTLFPAAELLPPGVENIWYTYSELAFLVTTSLRWLLLLLWSVLGPHLICNWRTCPPCLCWAKSHDQAKGPAPQLVAAVVAAAVAKAFISCPANRLQFINFERNYFITAWLVAGSGDRVGDGDGDDDVAVAIVRITVGSWQRPFACCI